MRASYARKAGASRTGSKSEPTLVDRGGRVAGCRAHGEQARSASLGRGPAADARTEVGVEEVLGHAVLDPERFESLFRSEIACLQDKPGSKVEGRNFFCLSTPLFSAPAQPECPVCRPRTSHSCPLNSSTPLPEAVVALVARSRRKSASLPPPMRDAAYGSPSTHLSGNWVHRGVIPSSALRAAF